MSDPNAILAAPERLVLVDGKPDAIERDLRAAVTGRVALLDGAGARDKATFMSEVKRALQLPDYFGENWDALADSLDELHWRDEPVVIVVADADQLLAGEPDALEPLLHVVGDAFAPNPELPKSSLKLVLVGTAQAPVVAAARRLGRSVARV